MLLFANAVREAGAVVSAINEALRGNPWGTGTSWSVVYGTVWPLGSSARRVCGLCTCGSGMHPRRCVKHPDGYDWHVARLNAEIDADNAEDGE